MNGAGFGSYSETFQQQHRIRSMSWCEDGGLITAATNKLKSDCTLLKQDEIISSASLIRSDSIELPNCSAEVINLKKPSARKNAWGCLSYADLIAKAIESSPNQRLTLNQIYSWMVENVPYFRAKGQTNSSAGWKNSIRHNLSLHGRFVRVQNEGAGKSSWWMVNNNNRMQKTPRRRSTTMDSKSFEKKRKPSTISKGCSSLESPSLSASVPAFLGSCSQYQHQSLHSYHQFLHQQQHSQTQPLDSFETAFRPIDRQHCSNFSTKDQNFAAKSTNLGYDDNCFNNNNLRSEDVFENSLIGSSASASRKNDNHMSFCSTHSMTSKQSDSCQQFAVLPQPIATGLPDFFKLPDEAWRHYLPPSPNGLTETVISSESLTALLETGVESEIIDLVPPSISTFDESGHDHKKAEELKEQCMYTVDANERIPAPSGDCRSERDESTFLLHRNSFVSAFANQDKELTECPPSVLRHVLTSNNLEIHENVKSFTASDSSLSLFDSKLDSTLDNKVAFEAIASPADLAYSTLEGRTFSSNNHNTSNVGEFREASDIKNMSFTLPFKMPLSIENSAALATTAISSTVPLTTNCSDNEITVTSKA